MLGPLDSTPALGPPLTDQQILDAVGITAYYRGQAGSQSLRQRGYDAMFAALRAEQIPYDPAAAGCGATVPTGGAIKSLGFGETALTLSAGAIKLASPAALAAGTTLSLAFGAATLGLGAALTVFTVIYSHHKKQVAKERQVLCAAVPAANESLRVIETAIQNGQIAPAQAIAYLDDLFNQAQGAFGAIIKSDATHCNAACVWRYCLAAIVARKKDRYAHMTVVASGARAAADRCNAWLAAGAPVPSQVPAGWRSPCSTEGPPPLSGDPTTSPVATPPARAPANQGGPLAAALAVGGAAWWLLV